MLRLRIRESSMDEHVGIITGKLSLYNIIWVTGRLVFHLHDNGELCLFGTIKPN